ncbi:solute carrier organic anion transporter family member [Elysia marginata]|uniref:Solute carrier organic anion transporter family member n=1 Tax=Elysia marginata TaxID=1093978 RepID=A0AAV4J9X9_9GAST|nr:solute carrier organic anion transporter family member [Elysia marginata]
MYIDELASGLIKLLKIEIEIAHHPHPHKNTYIVSCLHQVYHNCTCIGGHGQASGGMCPYGCGYLYAFFIGITIRGLFGTLSIIPKLVVIIRCVSPKDKGLALGFSSFCASLLGWLLGPIIFGYVIDGICTVWDMTSPGVRGRCLLYDNDVFRLKIHGYSTIALLACVSCLLFGYIYARYTGCLDDPPPDPFKGQDKNQKVKTETNGDT